MNGGCYYFQTPYSKTFNEAKTDCKTIFGNGINGRIYEPRNKEQMNLVLKEAYSFSSGWWYTGVTNLLSSSEIRYDSDNELVTMEMPWSSRPPSSKGCVYAYRSNDQFAWAAYDCKCCLHLICEVA